MTFPTEWKNNYSCSTATPKKNAEKIQKGTNPTQNVVMTLARFGIFVGGFTLRLSRKDAEAKARQAFRDLVGASPVVLSTDWWEIKTQEAGFLLAS